MSLYQINLNNLAIIGYAPGACYCGAGSIYAALPALPGDSFDFGHIKFDAYRIGHTQDFDLFGNHPVYWNVGNIGVSYDPTTFMFPYTLLNTIPSGNAFDLFFTVPDNAYSIQLAFNDTGIYLPPAVPELATWALLLLGFILVGARQWRSTSPAF